MSTGFGVNIRDFDHGTADCLMPLEVLVGGEDARDGGQIAQIAVYLKCIHPFLKICIHVSQSVCMHVSVFQIQEYGQSVREGYVKFKFYAYVPVICQTGVSLRGAMVGGEIEE